MVIWFFCLCLREIGAALGLPVVDQYLRERDDCFSLKWCHCADERVTWVLSPEHIKHGNWSNESK